MFQIEEMAGVNCWATNKCLIKGFTLKRVFPENFFAFIFRRGGKKGKIFFRLKKEARCFLNNTSSIKGWLWYRGTVFFLAYIRGRLLRQRSPFEWLKRLGVSTYQLVVCKKVREEASRRIPLPGRRLS